MTIDFLPIAGTNSTDGALVLAGAVVGAVGTVLVAGITPIGEWISRKDSLKSYRRNVYRNFLDHAYWHREGSLDDDNRQERAEKYVADWHRIQLIGGSDVRAATKGLRSPGSLTPEKESNLITVFQRELKVGGLTED